MFDISWPGGSWEATAMLVVVVIGLYVAALWLTLTYWTARDIRQRSSSPAVQVAAPLAVLLGFVPGLLLYLVTRPRLTLAQQYARVLEEEVLRVELDRQVSCPRCSHPVRDEYIACPSCRVRLKQPCLACSRPLANAWRVCPFCGVERARPARQAASMQVVPSNAGGSEKEPVAAGATVRDGTSG